MTRPDHGFASPLADAMAQFILHKQVLGRCYQTETCALRLFDRYLSTQGLTTLDGLTPRLVEAFLATRPRSRPRSYNHLLGVLRRFFQWLVARGQIARSPVLCPTRRDVSLRTPFIIAPEQARRLLEQAAQLPDAPGVPLRGPTYHAVFAVLYGLGLRVGEACGLDVVDVDRPRQLLVIRHTKFRKDRLVPFGPRLGEVLDRYLAMRRAHDQHLTASAPLFAGRGGGRLRRQQIGRIFRALLPALGLVVPSGTIPPHVHEYADLFVVPTLPRTSCSGRSSEAHGSA